MWGRRVAGWLGLCSQGHGAQLAPVAKAGPAPASGTGATASLPNPTQRPPTEPLTSPVLLLSSGFSSPNRPGFSHHHAAYKATVHTEKCWFCPAGAGWRQPLCQLPPCTAFPDGACPHVLWLDSHFQPICDCPSLPLPQCLALEPAQAALGMESMGGSKQGDKSPKECSSCVKKRAERRFTSAPCTAALCKQEGCLQSRARLPPGPALLSS